MEERRLHSRHGTEMQLEVFDLNSGQRLGRIVDLSADGFMLFSDTPHSPDAVLQCRLVCAGGGEALQEVRLGADCLWSRPGADGRHCWAGFHIIDLAEDQAKALESLLARL
ncbi:PilZ domain-containing protein [Pseudomonas oleovorans]|uniref:PilZ domain-containing protein n=1 Tax=Ectopseudomonas oleovorans TaxID=301 RepID=A0AB35KY70_ECTOL|nr:PilZ domain-containing protein [Pseudomonas oleovorans]MDH0566204.1 PilZ domain-containing protein [Pseudomonas oleovorans]PZP81171.1 MAG: pilus assembly protein PilZ [Pseudomonas oleovorans]